jgi:hypothetical protein
MMQSRASEALSSFQNWAEGTPFEVSSFSTWAIHAGRDAHVPSGSYSTVRRLHLPWEIVPKCLSPSMIRTRPSFVETLYGPYSTTPAVWSV